MAWNDEPQPTLTTARLMLRPFTTADGPRVDELAGAREIADTTTQVPHPYPAGGGAWWISTHGPDWAAGEQIVYAMTLADGGEVVGAISLVVNADANSAVLGYWLGVPYWNRGYTSEAAGAVVEFAFTTLGLNRVASEHMARNPASGRVMEKAGLALEGMQRQAIRKWGAYEDVVLRAILRSDWGRAADIMSPRFVDLSHEIVDGMTTHPGIAPPRISTVLSFDESAARYSAGTEFEIRRIEMVANTGTYLDTPAHRFRGGADLASVALGSVADLPGVMVDCRRAGQAGAESASARGIGAEDLAGVTVAGRAVLLLTGWDRHWGTPDYLVDNPFLTADGAAALVAAGAALVGIDFLNIDSLTDGRRPAHTAILAAGLPLVEHLTGLAALPASGFRFFAVPPRVQGMGTFPVRAFAIVEE